MTIATGLYPHNSNMWQNDSECPADADTYMRRLQGAGYRTCAIGKNHLFDMENCDLYATAPKYRAIGFDHIEDLSGTWGVIGGRSLYTDHLEQHGLMQRLREYLRQLEAQPDQVRRFVAEPLPIPAEHYIDAFIADRVARYVDGYDSSRPSFVFAGFQGPHEPWDAAAEYTERYPLDCIPDPIPEKADGAWLPARSRRYQRWAQYYQPRQVEDGKRIAASYFGKIAQIDDSVGRILAAYARKGWLDDTLILFASDHGEMLNDLGRLSKSVFYESALRVPLIVRPPGGIDGGRLCQGLVETVDLHATILDAAAAEANPVADGRSLMPLVRGVTGSVRDDALSEVHVHYMLRTDAWKLVVGRDGRTLQLFDLDTDPHEQCNLCGHPDYGNRELELRSRLLERIAGATCRPGRFDPEYSGHAAPPANAG